MLHMCIGCVVVYFKLVCDVSPRSDVVTQGPDGESRDVGDDAQHILFDARSF